MNKELGIKGNKIFMLSPYLQTKLVGKVLTDHFGRQFRCLFLVAVVDGEIKGKLIAAWPVSNSFLPAIPAPKKIYTERVWLPIVSYFAPKDFSFVMSQMTRAPSVK